MRGLVNDVVRFIIALSIVLLGVVLDLWQRIRIRRFAANQRLLKRKYRLHDDTPVLSYGPRVAEAIRHAATRAGRNARFAMTSGSTGEAKQILYTTRRLKALKFTFSDMFARACYAHKLRRTSLYVFSSFQQDDSLTSLLLNETELPPYLSTLQAPYRVQQHSAIRALVSEYGAAAVRLWILTISNPGVLYATNPSTITTFFHELETNWTICTKLVRDWHNHPQRFARTLHKIARRLDSRGSKTRLHLVANSSRPVPLEDFAPAVCVYICWTGGYVKPFLDRLSIHLPSPRYTLVAMYSMSTETIETETVFRNGETYFLPLARGVVYEFIEENQPDDAGNLLRPDQLQPEKSYAMVVSDEYGLRRYQTADLLECKRVLNHGRASNALPDLTFLRRRALEYSFTGEKLTAEQLTAVFNQLRVHYPEVLSTGFLTCVPSLSQRPHYKIVLISEKTVASPHLIATHCDELLREINSEYKKKRADGTLLPVGLIQINTTEFAKRFSNSWETQFKFLPLYQQTWESMSLFEQFESSPV